MAGVVVYYTKDEPKVYTSSAQIYTGITSGSSIISVLDSKVDRFTSLISFDNMINAITSRSTLEKVSIRLLATHLLIEQPVPEIISTEHFYQLMENVPEEVKKLVVKNDVESTVRNLTEYKESNYTNYIYKLVNSEHPNYSASKIQSSTKVRRVRSSDLIEISFNSNDPGICKNTLELLIEVFGKDYTENKLTQTHDVVKYFEQELAKASNKLESAEDELLYFNKKNSIINYYEQTEQITTEKKDFNLKFLDIKMAYAGARSAIVALEDKMSEKERQKLTNRSIQIIREKLAEVNFEIAMNTLSESVNAQTNSNLDSLSALSYKLEQELRTQVENQYDLEYSKEGVGAKSILSEWIEKVIEVESSRAKLNVAELQEKKFNDLYLRYAPLGATMKKLERKIDVIEREYLQILHDLGLAKLKQQNIEMSSNISVPNKPFFPITHQPSKRKILVAIALLLGFLVPSMLIIVLDFFDNSIKTADRAEAFIGLPVAAIFPNLYNVNRKLDLNFIKDHGLSIIARRLILNTEEKKPKTKPDTYISFSSLDSEGKTTVTSLLIEKLSHIGYKTLFVTFNEFTSSKFDTVIYKIGKSFHRIEKISELDPELSNLQLNEYDYVFIELPSILHHAYPINLFKEVDHSFLIARATRPWTKADINVLEDIVKYIPDKKPHVIVNGVEITEMENTIGDLPRRRSALRKFVKNVVLFRFNSKKKFTKNQNKRRLKNGSLKNLVIVILLPIVIWILVLSLTIPGENEPLNPMEGAVTFTDSVDQENCDTLAFSSESHFNIAVENSGEPSIQTFGVTNKEDTEFEGEVDPDLVSFGNNSEASSREDETQHHLSANMEVVENTKSMYYVICGSFNEQKNADDLYKQLKRMGYCPKFVDRGNSLKSVALGSFVTHGDAVNGLQAYLLKEPKSDAWIYRKEPKEQIE